MDTNSGLRGFDDYRLQRKRMQAKLGLQQNSLGYENNALKELEQVEAREVREQQLSREVHDFFAAATKQAAAIVEKVARDAESAIGSRIQEEMESFLRDALERVNGMVGALLVKQQRNPKLAQADVEPKIGNLDSQILDEFRWEGTAEGADKHIGSAFPAELVEDLAGKALPRAPTSTSGRIRSRPTSTTCARSSATRSAAWKARDWRPRRWTSRNTSWPPPRTRTTTAPRRSRSRSTAPPRQSTTRPPTTTRPRRRSRSSTGSRARSRRWCGRAR